MAFKTVGYEQLPTLLLDRNGEGTVSQFKLVNVKSVQSKFAPDQTRNVYTIEYEGADLDDLKKEFDIENNRMQFWGSAVLDSRLQEVELGSIVRVVYLGQEAPKERGRKPYKNYLIQVDNGRDGEDDPIPGKEAAPLGAKKKAPF